MASTVAHRRPSSAPVSRHTQRLSSTPATLLPLPPLGTRSASAPIAVASGSPFAIHTGACPPPSPPSPSPTAPREPVEAQRLDGSINNGGSDPFRQSGARGECASLLLLEESLRSCSIADLVLAPAAGGPLTEEEVDSDRALLATTLPATLTADVVSGAGRRRREGDALGISPDDDGDCDEEGQAGSRLSLASPTNRKRRPFAMVDGVVLQLSSDRVTPNLNHQRSHSPTPLRATRRHAGWLWKYSIGKTWWKPLGNWRRRYFTLDDRGLWYYDQQETTEDEAFEEARRVAKGHVPVSGAGTTLCVSPTTQDHRHAATSCGAVVVAPPPPPSEVSLLLDPKPPPAAAAAPAGTAPSSSPPLSPRLETITASSNAYFMLTFAAPKPGRWYRLLMRADTAEEKAAWIDVLTAHVFRVGEEDENDR